VDDSNFGFDLHFGMYIGTHISTWLFYVCL